jgi:hypothetical protein
MRIAKPLLLVTTPLGVIGAVHEAFRLAGGLGFLMLLLVSFMTVAIGGVVLTIRKEERLARASAQAESQSESQSAAAEGVEV